jgi:hypothetical protein
MPILGVIASSTRQGQATDTGVMFPLGMVQVGSGGTQNITFSSIPATYKHLQLRTSHATNNTTNIYFRINGSTTAAEYGLHYIVGTGSGSGSAASDVSHINTYGVLAYNSNPSNFTAAVTDFFDYTSPTKNKTVRNIAGQDNNGSGYIQLMSNLWINTAPITSLTILSTGGDFINQYSSFALYGIK